MRPLASFAAPSLILLLSLGSIAPVFAQTQTSGPFTSTITYRRTDLTSGVFNGTDITPYFSLPTFNQSLGTLLSVNLNYTLDLRTQITATNSASPGSAAVTVRSITASQTSLFYNTTGTSAGDQANLGGAFVNPAPDGIGFTNESAGVSTPTYTFSNLQPQETRTSPLITASSNKAFTFNANGYSGSGTTNDTVVNAFKGNGSTPIFFGIKTDTDAFQTSGGGNVTLSQITDDQLTLSVTYTYQAAVVPESSTGSLILVSSTIGLVGTGAARLRSIKRRKVA